LISLKISMRRAPSMRRGNPTIYATRRWWQRASSLVLTVSVIVDPRPSIAAHSRAAASRPPGRSAGGLPSSRRRFRFNDRGVIHANIHESNVLRCLTATAQVPDDLGAAAVRRRGGRSRVWDVDACMSDRGRRRIPRHRTAFAIAERAARRLRVGSDPPAIRPPSIGVNLAGIDVMAPSSPTPPPAVNRGDRRRARAATDLDAFEALSARVRCGRARRRHARLHRDLAYPEQAVRACIHPSDGRILIGAGVEGPPLPDGTVGSAIAAEDHQRQDTRPKPPR
jgi:hypothetical protein